GARPEVEDSPAQDFRFRAAQPLAEGMVDCGATTFPVEESNTLPEVLGQGAERPRAACPGLGEFGLAEKIHHEKILIRFGRIAGYADRTAARYLRRRRPPRDIAPAPPSGRGQTPTTVSRAPARAGSAWTCCSICEHSSRAMRGAAHSTSTGR